VEATLEALLDAGDKKPLDGLKPCDIQKLACFLTEKVLWKKWHFK
jgi:hypothetical protein